MNQGYTLESTTGGGVDFDLRTAWSPRLREEFARSGADGLIANYARGFSGHDLRFVADLPLRRLTVLARTIGDLSPVYQLAATLEELHVTTGHATRVDLGALPQLRALSCAWVQVADTIEATTTLEHLSAGEYDPPDLGPLSHLTSLRYLQLKGRPAVRSLDGLQAMGHLQHLGVYVALLEDTTALAQLDGFALRELHLATCRKVSSLEHLLHLTGLRYLDVSEGGTLDSLRPLARLEQLRWLYLYGSTTVADGDLAPLLGLPHLADLRMMNRRHYTPAVRVVQEQLERRAAVHR